MQRHQVPSAFALANPDLEVDRDFRFANNTGVTSSVNAISSSKGDGRSVTDRVRSVRQRIPPQLDLRFSQGPLKTLLFQVYYDSE